MKEMKPYYILINNVIITFMNKINNFFLKLELFPYYGL